MSDGSINFPESNPLLKESSMGDQRSKLRARPLVLVSTLLFIGYVCNILLGMLVIQYSVEVPYLDDLWEFLMLFGSAIGFVVFVLLNESDDD